jgi:hypothetical protein
MKKEINKHMENLKKRIKEKLWKKSFLSHTHKKRIQLKVTPADCNKWKAEFFKEKKQKNS